MENILIDITIRGENTECEIVEEIQHEETPLNSPFIGNGVKHTITVPTRYGKKFFAETKQEAIHKYLKERIKL